MRYIFCVCGKKFLLHNTQYTIIYYNILWQTVILINVKKYILHVYTHDLPEIYTWRMWHSRFTNERRFVVERNAKHRTALALNSVSTTE